MMTVRTTRRRGRRGRGCACPCPPQSAAADHHGRSRCRLSAPLLEEELRLDLREKRRLERGKNSPEFGHDDGVDGGSDGEEGTNTEER
jgi:hypothetical protein